MLVALPSAKRFSHLVVLFTTFIHGAEDGGRRPSVVIPAAILRVPETRAETREQDREGGGEEVGC